MRTTFWLSVALSIAAAAVAPASAQGKPGAAEQEAIQRLKERVAELATHSGGTMGVSVVHLDTGERFSVNGDIVFPMASTFKLGVAARILHRVDRGELKLDQMIPVPKSMYVNSAIIADSFPHAGVALSLANLLEVMLVESDNTATDVLMKLAGGGPAVTARLRQLGITGQRLDRDTSTKLRELYGLGEGPYQEARERFLKSGGTFPNGTMPNPRYDTDPRDTTTPDAMAALLEAIFNGRALSPRSTAFMIDVMERCKTGPDRLKGLLPAGTVVAHKTGTNGGSLNDAGVITLPGQAGRVIVATYIKSSAKPQPERARTIAEISRTVYDYFAIRRR
jgi:beta-lactamase class A